MKQNSVLKPHNKEERGWIAGEIQSLLEMIESINQLINQHKASGIDLNKTGAESFLRFKGQLVEQLNDLLNEFDLGVQLIDRAKAA